jgi:hypothetical protein
MTTFMLLCTIISNSQNIVDVVTVYHLVKKYIIFIMLPTLTMTNWVNFY